VTARITIVLAEDHQVVREGLKRLLEAEPDLSVVGEVADGLEVVALVERIKPRVLITDLMIPGIGGLEVARQVTKRAPGTRIVVLSMHIAESYVLEALKSGAAAYVPKDAPGTELVRAVHEVAAGRKYLAPPLSDTLISAYLAHDAAQSSDPYDTLTPREREVLHLSAQGLTNKEIARRLDLSPRTAESHRANLMRKLGLHTQTDLIRLALQRGILPQDPQ
jgi:two-component system, NarL family, response regulator NreC